MSNWKTDSFCVSVCCAWYLPWWECSSLMESMWNWTQKGARVIINWLTFWMWQVMNQSELAWSFLWDNTHRGNPHALKWSVIKWALYFPQMPALFCLVSNHLRTYNCWSQHPSQHLHLGAWVQDSQIPNTGFPPPQKKKKRMLSVCSFFPTSKLPQPGKHFICPLRDFCICKPL